MGIGSLFSDIAGGIGRGTLALGTLGISEIGRSQQNDIGQILANAQNPGEAISALGQLGTPAAVQLATELIKNQPAFNPLTPKDVASVQASVYAANPLMNAPPNLSGGQGQQQQAQAAPQQGAAQSPNPYQGVDPHSLTGDDWLGYLAQKAGPGFANQVKAIAEGRAAPPSPSSQNKTAQLLNQAVAQYNPGYDFASADQNFKNRAATETEFTKGSAAGNIRSIGTASNHLATLVGQIAGVANTPNSIVNSVENWWDNKMVGKSGITKFNQTADALASELGAVYKGAGHNSDTEIGNMRKALDANASPDQKFGALENGLHLMEGRALELAQQYNTGKNLGPNDAGYKTPDDFLSPEAKTNIGAAKQAITAFKQRNVISTPVQGAPAPTAGPQVGQVIKGYKYLGGDPANKASWTK